MHGSVLLNTWVKRALLWHATYASATSSPSQNSMKRTVSLDSGEGDGKVAVRSGSGPFFFLDFFFAAAASSASIWAMKSLATSFHPGSANMQPNKPSPWIITSSPPLSLTRPGVTV